MGNTAAVASGGCCCENNGHTPRLRRSPLLSKSAPSNKSEESETAPSLHKCDSARLVATAGASENHAISTNANLITNMPYDSEKEPSAARDRLGQRAFSQGVSLATGLNQFRGFDFIANGRLNKGLTYTIEERQKLGILGLLPAAVKTAEEEVARCKANLSRLTENLDKYVYLAHLQESNEKLFYKLMSTDVSEYMPLVYTPVVGLACQQFSLLFQKPPRGLFITIYDKGHIYDVLKNWPEQDVRAIVVTDGERILGLGDLGANGMGIPIGKLSLYTALAGVKPSQCLPITLDVGTNTESILNDPFYIGLRQKRVTGQEYDDFVDEFMDACVRRFGMNTLIQFEDFANHNAFKLLAKYREKYCVFNDDIQGTASVAVAGLLASLKLTKTRLSDHVIMFQGAGEASLGIAQLCVMAMLKEGTSEKDARDKIWMVDSKGLIVLNRPEGGVTGHKTIFAKNYQPIRDLDVAVKTIKPSILIGASAIGGAFTADILKAMGSFNKSPVIFALSNPTSKAECTAEQAYTHTNGRAIFASGSPFPPVTIDGKTFEPGQGNNSYVFPGIALGVICAGVKVIHEELFLIAASALADLVQESDLEVGRLYPPLQSIQKCSIKIAAAIMRRAYETDVATTFPKPCDMEEFIKCQMYDTTYEPATFPEYSYPKL